MWRSSQALNQVARAILATSGDLTLLMDTVESVASTLHYDHAGVFLLQENGDLELAVGYGYFLSPRFGQERGEVLEGVRRRLAPAPGRVGQRDLWAGEVAPGIAWQTLFPLAAGKRVLGALLVGADRVPDDPEEALALGESLAGLVAVGVQNVLLYLRREELAAATERDRIAREIHDGIAQTLYMLSLTLESCAEATEEPGASALKERLYAALTLCRSALWESRQYLLDVTPLLSEKGSLGEALQSLVKESRAIGPITVRFTATGEERELALAVRTAVYRVAQESLANVYKHARASQAEVALDLQPDRLCLEVSDDGMGFPHMEGAAGDTPTHGGHGLKNMRERLSELGGSLEVVSGPGRGTRVVAIVPC